MLPADDRRPARPLRVLMTADAVGGVWQYAIDLSSVLLRRGAHVTLAVMGPSPRESQLSAAAAIGLDVVGAPFKLEWMDDPWVDVDEAGRWLLALERDLRPTVIHLNGYCHADLDWRAPVIVAAHSCVCSWWRGVHRAETPGCYARYRTRVSRGLAAATIVAAPTAAMLAALGREYGDTIPHARVIPNGRRSIEPTPAWSPSKAAFVFAAGRVWDEAKNIAALDAIAASLDWPVYVAGDTRPPDGDSCVLAGAASSGATYLGRLPEVDVRRWLERAAIYALPARYEPFGLSILEAASAGCALVLGDIDSLRENWSGAALFVDPDDRRALASGIQRLIHDRGEQERLGRLARARARCFDIERTADEYLRAYGDGLAIHRHDRVRVAGRGVA
jgi:glycogen synthase